MNELEALAQIFRIAMEQRAGTKTSDQMAADVWTVLGGAKVYSTAL
jgi:hypothetical protein